MNVTFKVDKKIAEFLENYYKISDAKDQCDYIWWIATNCDSNHEKKNLLIFLCIHFNSEVINLSILKTIIMISQNYITAKNILFENININDLQAVLLPLRRTHIAKFAKMQFPKH